MDAIIGFANAVFTPVIDLGAAPVMTIVLTIIALCFKVKFTDALMGGASSWASPLPVSALLSISLLRRSPSR